MPDSDQTNPYNSSREDLFSVLAEKFGGRFDRAASMREQHGHTVTSLPNQPPEAVVFAQTTQEVSQVLKLCHAHRVPVIPFGAGSSLEGHLNAPFGGISLDLSQMDQLLEIHHEDLDCVVQPGITRKALNTQLRDTGMFFPIDPGADATLGGMAATRASGTNAVRYGTMKDNVLSLEVVLADGKIIRTASRARKSSAGLDLTRLFIGSEGTLGVITELTLKLQGIPAAISSARCAFPNVHAACEAAILTIQSGIPVARIEFLDENQVRAVNLYSKTNLPETPLLLLEFHGSEASVQEQARDFGEIARDLGGTDFEWTDKTEDRNRLWQARHDAYWAALGLRPGGHGLSTDICVPISRLADAVTESQKKATDLDLTFAIVGHVGDGNFHVLVMSDPNDSEEIDRGRKFVSWLNDLSHSMGGTCTGEHGVGQGKKPYLYNELGDALTVMGDIKKTLDPRGILNPGKIYA